MDDSTISPSGWIFAYDAQNLVSQAFPLYYPTAPGYTLDQKAGAGIWQGGAGLAAGTDENGGNYLYFSTANGYFDLNNTSGLNTDSADSVVKLTTDLQPASGTYYFTPSDQVWRQCFDMDRGSAGTLLLPDSTFAASRYAVKADKENLLFVIDRLSPGGYAGYSTCGNCVYPNGCKPNNVNCTPCNVQNNNLPEPPFLIASQNGTNNINGPYARATPAFWGGSTNSDDVGELYYAASGGQLSRYPVSSHCNTWGKTGNPPICNAQKTTTLDPLSDQLGYSATPSVSSSGVSQNNNGIVWAIQSSSAPLGGPRPRILFAFDANTLSELYDSTQCSTRDNNGFGFG